MPPASALALLESLRTRPLPGQAAWEPLAPGYRLDLLKAASPEGWREAAVLILLYTVDDELRFPLIVRTGGQGVHAGQVALPGGSREPEESLYLCALREAHEELGINPASVEFVRALTPLPIPPSRFVAHPFLAYSPTRPHFIPSPREVASMFEPALAQLQETECLCLSHEELEGRLWPVPYYRLLGHRVWGATAMMLAELAALVG